MRTVTLTINSQTLDVSDQEYADLLANGMVKQASEPSDSPVGPDTPARRSRLKDGAGRGQDGATETGTSGA